MRVSGDFKKKLKKIKQQFQKSVDISSFMVYNHYCLEGHKIKTKKQSKKVKTGCGSVWLECLIWDQEVAGSNPVTPIFSFYNTFTCGCSSMVEH